MKCLEDALLLFGRDAGPGITHFDSDFVIDLRGNQFDPSPLGREFDCISKQVHQDLPEACSIGANGQSSRSL